mgnify:FL=1
MAVTEIHPITTTLNKALDYIMNPKKTDNTLLVDGYACSPQIAFYEFNQVKKNADKTGGTLALHLIQSFSPGEVDYETAHKIGIELADKILKGRFQYVVATHTDKGHIHNHILINSVSFKDKKRYHSSPNSYYYIRRTSDKLCKEYGLSVIDNPKEKGKSHYEHSQEKQGKSWKTLLRQTIDRCILKAQSWDDFLILMQRENYEIKTGKHIAFRAEGQERFTRAKTLGADYSEEQIRNRIVGQKNLTTAKGEKINLLIDIENRIKNQQQNTVGLENWAKINNIKMAAQTHNYLTEHNLLDYDVLSAKVDATRERYNGTRSKIKDIEKQLKSIEESIQNIDNYRKTKPIADRLQTVVFKERYRREHESELIVFSAAEKYIKKTFKDEKPPLIRELRAEQKALLAEKDKLYKDYYSAKCEMSELQTIKKNVDTILGKDKEQEQSRNKKRSGELE